VVAQFAWQLFVKGLLRGNVIDGGRARRHRTGAFCIRDLANAITEKREVDDEEGGRERQKWGFNKDTESVGA